MASIGHMTVTLGEREVDVGKREVLPIIKYHARFHWTLNKTPDDHVIKSIQLD